MKKTIFFSAIILFMFPDFFVNNVLSWDNEKTHRDISEYAADFSALDKTGGDFLRNLGFKEGLAENLKWSSTEKTAMKWLSEGAYLEDDAPRWLNHFHNPLKPWSDAGLWGNSTMWKSSILWAQDGAFQMTATGNGDWSWQTTKNYFYSALTAEAKTAREAYFARTFRGLGQQMHLVQDMAVLMHVRNDRHIVNQLIEGRAA